MIDEAAIRQLLIDSYHSSVAAEKFFRCHLDDVELLALRVRIARDAADYEGDAPVQAAYRMSQYPANLLRPHETALLEMLPVVDGYGGHVALALGKTRSPRGREQHQLSATDDLVFLEVCVDDPSEFFQRVMIEVVRDSNRYVIRVTNCVSTSHAIAAIALEMSRYSKPPGVHFGWPEQNMLSASWSYLAFGAGNIPWKVRELVQRMEPDPAKRPRVIVG